MLINKYKLFSKIRFMYINQKKIKPIAKPFIPSAKFREFVKVNIQINVKNIKKPRSKKNRKYVYKIYL